MSTEEVSPAQIESTRTVGARLLAEFTNEVALFTQVRAAACMGTSASTVSRVIASEELVKVCQMMAAMGWQFAPLDAVVVERHDIQALERMAYKYLQTRIESDRRGL